MFSLFKNLFNKPAEEKPVTPPSPPSAPPRPATPSPVAEKQVASATPVAASAPQPATPVISANETISVSLKGIVATLPDTLKSRTLKAASPDIRISVPLVDAVAQLAKGSVKIPFGQLRQQAPDLFTPDASQDATPVSLPLGEILPQIRPNQLSRRTDQKRVEVPDEVTSAFGGRGSDTARVVSTPVASVSAPPPPAPTPAAVPTRKPVAPVEPPKAVTPAAPIATPPVTPPPAPINPAPVATPPAEPAEAFIAPEPKPVDNTPIKPSFSLPDPAALRPTTPPAPAVQPPASPVAAQPIKPAATLPTPTELKLTTPTPPPAAPAEALTTLKVPLATIIAKWPDGVRNAIATIDVNQTSLVLPMAETEAGMRKGKVHFAWKQIRSYLAPAVNPTLLAEADEVMLELPLATLAPLFMAAKKPVTQKKVAVGENIPDLFKPKPPEPVAIAEPTPAPVEAAPAPAEPAAVAKKPLTPAEVIQQAVAMADVAGALITTTDGLLVDAQLPTGMDAAKIAAFVPQAYLRLAELTKAMSGAENPVVTLQLDHAPVALFKHANIYCAVVGKRGLSLPLKHLAALLNELAAQPK